MFRILPLTDQLTQILKKHHLERKFTKQSQFLSENPKYPSLHIERLQPKENGLYSFRIDLKYRAIFFFNSDEQAFQVVDITVHYH